MTAQFELLFEGPIDDTAPTLRRIKGVFIADLEFPASDVQRFLENAPITIKAANSENELKETYTLLSNAGARVLIVKVGQARNAQENNNLELELSPFTMESDPAFNLKEVLHHTENDSENSLELSFDFESDPLVSKPNDTGIENNDLKQNEYFQDELSLDLSFENHNPDSTTEIHKEDERQKPDASIAVAAKNNIEDSSDILGLELDVVAPATSTLFGHHENHPEPKEQTQTSIKSDADLTHKESIVSHSEVSPNITEDRNNEIKFKNEEVPIELTLEELKALQSPPPKRIKLSITPILTVLCLASLFYLNQWFFNDSPQENPFIALVEQFPKISTESDSALQEKLLAEKAAQLAQTAWFISEQNFPNRSVKATVWAEKNAPIHGSVEITTPEPAALSKEEIVNGVAPRPWLRHLDLKDLVFKLENSNWVAAGPALAYITIGEKNIRATGTATLQAKLNEDGKTLSLKALAFSQQPPSNLKILKFSVVETGKQTANSFEYAEEITLNRQ